MDSNKNNRNKDDHKLKSLFSESKIQASENLKYRIMQQIETEAAIKGIRKKEKIINSQIRNIITVAVVMYILIVLSALFTYFYFGEKGLTSPYFLMTISFIVIVSVTFGMIGYFDGKLRSKLKTE